jgi:hypothetical protein
VSEIEQYRVNADVDSVYYVKDYITEESETLLLKCVNELDKERWYEMRSGRSLKRYGGEVDAHGLINSEPLP